MNERMVGLVEMMMTADSSRLTAYGPDEDRIRLVEGAAEGSRRTACGRAWVRELTRVRRAVGFE